MSASTEFISSIVIWVPIALILFGIGTAQTYFYFIEYEDDALPLKVSVAILWILESTHTALCIHVIYTYAAADFGNTAAIAKIAWSASATVSCEVLIICVVQFAFTYRAWLFYNRRLLIAVVPGITLFARTGFGLGSVSYLWIYPTWASFASAKGPIYTINFSMALGVLLDAMTCALLIHQLIATGAHLRVAHSRNLVRKLVIYAIGTGAITVLCTMGVLITYNLQPARFNWAGMVEVLTKLYTNALLANLNARKYLRNMRARSQVRDSIQLAANRDSEHKAAQDCFTGQWGGVQILQETTITTDRDVNNASPAKSELFGAPV